MAHTTWVVVADAARARIFQTEPVMTSWDEVADLTHPESRLSTSDLVTDARGTRRTGSGPRSGPTEHRSPHDLKEAEFASTLADWLKDARQGGRFAHLLVATTPRFHDLARQEEASRKIDSFEYRSRELLRSERREPVLYN